jgi:hypothetical protein
MKKNIKVNTLFQTCSLLILLLLFGSCNLSDLNKNKPSNNLSIGKEVEVASNTISSSGGTITVDTPGSEIDGLEIDVPSKSYSTSKTFKITTAAITGHTLGQYFNPITPLIQIENGGGYADSIMEITIPIDIAAGEIPLGFFYDEITGKLEAIPVKEYTQKSITLLTRHFMSASELSSDNLKSGGIKIDATSNLIISSIAESVLKGKKIISSGFKMEVDNWEFVNHGSYISPGGHCAGQNMAAMWYYFEKKLKGEGQLFGKFSTISSIDEDNAIGYRFCSVIQEDLSSEGQVINIFDKYVDKNQSLDRMKFYAIAGAMLTTGEPQGIGIYRTIDNDNNGIPDTYTDGSLKYGGHDLICYQIGIDEGKLYICDPNYPKAGQIIEYENNKFKPYSGKANGHASAYQYPFVTWYAKTAWIDWPQVGKRYVEVLDSTIGNKVPNTFPAYTIWVEGKEEEKLKNGYTTDTASFICWTECPSAEAGNNYGGSKMIATTVLDENGKNISRYRNGDNCTMITLKPGLNKLGFYIEGWRNSALIKDINGNDKYRNLFIDFKWFNIFYSKLEISPNPITGKPDEEIKITALSGGTAPKNANYVWDFGDGSKEVTVKNDSTVIHKFTKEGLFTVSLNLFDNSTKKLVGHSTASATISSIPEKKFKYFTFSLSGSYFWDKTIKSEILKIEESFNHEMHRKCIQNGNSITASWNDSLDYLGSNFDPEISNKGTATFTLEGDNLVTYTYSNKETLSWQEETVTITGTAPLDKTYMTGNGSDYRGSGIQTVSVKIINKEWGIIQKSTGISKNPWVSIQLVY